MKQMKIAAVSYLNTIPMLRGIRSSGLHETLDVILAHPAQCAELFATHEVDLALCPVGALAELPRYQIVGTVGIGCEGPVRTVAVYSDAPLDELKAIKLYGESRSSNLLVQVLDAYYWQYGFDFIQQGESHHYVPRATGHLFIGDICFEKENEYRHRIDLGEEWLKYTGLPFLFAVWVSHKPLPQKFKEEFDNAMRQGIAKTGEMQLPDPGNNIDAKEYLESNIRYEVDDKALRGMQLFLNLVQDLNQQEKHVSQVASR